MPFIATRTSKGICEMGYHGMDLEPVDQLAVNEFTDQLKRKSAHELSDFALKFTHSDEPSWWRFAAGVKSHPVTWWIGIFQLQMQVGIWGRERQAIASSRADLLMRPLKAIYQAASTASPTDAQIDFAADTALSAIGRVINFNLAHRKADLVGRAVGGVFTGYASAGGRMGSGRTASFTSKAARGATNLVLASYGAAIRSVGLGYTQIDEITHSILTGNMPPLPAEARTMHIPLDAEGAEAAVALGQLTPSLIHLASKQQGPVPIAKFCSRPENAHLKGVCR